MLQKGIKPTLASFSSFLLVSWVTSFHYVLLGKLKFGGILRVTVFVQILEILQNGHAMLLPTSIYLVPRSLDVCVSAPVKTIPRTIICRHTVPWNNHPPTHTLGPCFVLLLTENPGHYLHKLVNAFYFMFYIKHLALTKYTFSQHQQVNAFLCSCRP